MRAEQEMVREFHTVFRHPVADRPAELSPERVENRAVWLAEEVEEFRRAQTLDEQADAIVDLIYFALGTLVEMGVDGAPLFHIVHQANMRKLWADGGPKFGNDGKVQKPPGWVDPHDALRQEIARQRSARAGAPRMDADERGSASVGVNPR
ncbi:MAG TPA: HAD family hydrolase [Phycisphaerae bacterium]|jgi:predicted HAD superfamily Cof-like phosphohydrolase